MEGLAADPVAGLVTVTGRSSLLPLQSGRRGGSAKARGGGTCGHGAVRELGCVIAP